MKVLTAFLLVFALVCPTHAEKHRDLQTTTTELAPTASWAVVPISLWYNYQAPGQQKTEIEMIVVGTGFVVDDRGDFVTAAHVLDLESIKNTQGVTDARLTAVIRQREAGGSGQAFSVTEIDKGHDLALCRISGFHVYTPEESPTAKSTRAQEQSGMTVNVDTAHPFASLAISQTPPQMGRFIIVSGFPLGSWTPTIQLGMISATETLYDNPVVGRVGKDSRQLLQISVNANHGNSGGPVIDVSTGRVVGVILQLVPAPIEVQGHQFYDAGTFAMSGIMLAAPASWVESLLERHQLKSQSKPVGKLVIY